MRKFSVRRRDRLLKVAVLGFSLAVPGIAAAPFWCASRDPGLEVTVQGELVARCGDHAACPSWARISGTIASHGVVSKRFHADLYGAHPAVDFYELGAYQGSLDSPVHLRIDMSPDGFARRLSFLSIGDALYPLACDQISPQSRGPYGMGGDH